MTSLRDTTLVMKAYDELKVNALSLEYALTQSYGLELPHNRIHAISKETGRALGQPSKQMRRKWVRYEREHSMDLWHTDWKQLDTGDWWIAYLDDASRLATGYGVFQEATAENTIRVSEQTIAKCGCPRKILTDRGTQFYASEGERKEKGIKHILSRINHPQTNRKLERFYGVYDQKRHQFKSIDEYVHWHNEMKPHLSLNFETPIQVFYKKFPLERTENIHTTQDAK